jgi:acyl carrier protein
MADIVDDLVDLVVRELQLDPEAVGPDTKLFEGGLELDSFAVVDLVTRVESHFDVRVPDAEFSPENFETMRTLAGLVERARAAAVSGATAGA